MQKFNYTKLVCQWPVNLKNNNKTLCVLNGAIRSFVGLPPQQVVLTDSDQTRVIRANLCTIKIKTHQHLSQYLDLNTGTCSCRISDRYRT